MNFKNLFKLTLIGIIFMYFKMITKILKLHSKKSN